MAENIQALIDLLSDEILKYDLSHIRGDEIVNGNPEHCINLLQLAKEISQMLQNQQEGQDPGPPEESDEQRRGIADESEEGFDEYGEEQMQMDDVSINLEDGMPEQREDYDDEQEDPLQMAQEALMGQADEADMEIEQIINKRGYSEEFEYDQEVED